MFHAVDAALIRAASYPQDLALPDWPDLTVDQPEQWLAWLRKVWALPEFSDAVLHAAPQLATRIDEAVAGAALETRRLRRLVEAVVRYLLRWTTRATPFGHFAGVAPVELGARAAVRWGSTITTRSASMTVSSPSTRLWQSGTCRRSARSPW